MSSAADTLFCFPVAGLVSVPVSKANELVVEWGHNLGACERPFGSQGWALEIGGRYEAVALSASTVSESIPCDSGVVLHRNEVVELARCCAPNDWANRVMLRLWREVAVRHWPYWNVRAAVSYSDSNHTGDLYRFDGWKLQGERGASGGGGSWTKPRRGQGKKKLWVWEYA